MDTIKNVVSWFFGIFDYELLPKETAEKNRKLLQEYKDLKKRLDNVLKDSSVEPDALNEKNIEKYRVISKECHESIVTSVKLLNEKNENSSNKTILENPLVLKGTKCKHNIGICVINDFKLINQENQKKSKVFRIDILP